MSKVLKIKVCEENAVKIADALEAVNGRAERWTISSAYEVEEVARRAERWLDKAHLPKGRRRGAEVSFTPAGPAAQAYGNGVISTHIVLRRGTRDWFLVKVERVTLPPGRREKMFVGLTKDLRAAAVEWINNTFHHVPA